MKVGEDTKWVRQSKEKNCCRSIKKNINVHQIQMQEFLKFNKFKMVNMENTNLKTEK